MTLHDDARRVVAGLGPGHPLAGDYLAFLDEHADATWRECDHGHITASALVVDPSRGRVLLMLHAKIGRWLQMGGHCEPGDPSLRDAAAREAREESGIVGLEVGAAPVNLDRHTVTCGGRVLDHLDIQYLAVASPDAVEVMNDESHALRWFAYDEVPAEDTAVLRLVARARELGG